MLLHHFQDYVMRDFGWFTALLPAGTALALQPNAAPDISGKDQKQSLRQLADSADVRITMSGPRASSNFVTVEEVQHIVPTAVGLDRTDGYARLLLGVVLVNERKFTEEALRCLTQARDELPQ